jgi:hypothetical protein
MRRLAAGGSPSRQLLAWTEPTSGDFAGVVRVVRTLR